MNDFIESILSSIDGADLLNLFINISGTLVMVFIIIIFFNLLQLFTGKFLKKILNPQGVFIVKKIIKYTGFVLCALFLFNSMGFDTTAILGAAGVIGIAVGFASQTTIASFISGFFLLSEKPFKVGDVIQVDNIFGEVLSVDLLSVKLRTFDNLYVRLPNETLIKSNMMNLTRFPVRRLDIRFNITYETDLQRVKEILEDTAAKEALILENPAPLFRVEQFDRSGPVINFTIWADSMLFVETRTAMYMAIQKRFAKENIELPYQKVEVITGGELRQ